MRIDQDAAHADRWVLADRKCAIPLRQWGRLTVRYRSVRTRQEGQVIPMTLVFIAAVMLSLWIMYDSGQIMTQKIKLQNTADNVAYSSAALVSRDLNFSAYTNRAMVANEVGIAQMVGMSSYTTFLKQTATNADDIATALSWIPVFGQIFKAATSALKQGATAFDDATELFAAQLIPLSDDFIGQLSKSQRHFHTTALLAAAQFSSEIGRLNDPDAISFSSVGDFGNLLGAVGAYAKWDQQIVGQNRLQDLSDTSQSAQAQNVAYRQFGRIVNHSRDRFSRRRSYQWGMPFSGGLGLGPEIETRKYGGTELHRAVGSDGRYHWDWAAMDTAGLYTRVCAGFFGCSGWSDPDFPLGWGAAHAVNDNHGGGGRFKYDEPPRKLDRDDAWGHGAWRNEMAATIDAGQYADHKIAALQVLQPFYAFKDDETHHDYGPATIAIYLKNDDKLSSEHTMLDHIAPDIDTNGAGSLIHHRISAAAKAQPYFARATDLTSFARHDRHYEHGNLYNPFWQPRLVELTPTEKRAVAAAVAGIH